jgi:rfaE bifunctional protein kinase chain/domain
MRVDEEHTHPINSNVEQTLFEKIKQIIQSEKIDIIVFEDYDKGCITEQLIVDVVAFSNEKSIPIVVDPKKRNFLTYKNVSLFKPNLKELKEGLKLDFDAYNHKALIEAAKLLKDKLQAKSIMITLSEQGVLIMDNAHTEIIPAHIRNIADVSGAGDTVISVCALAIAAGLSIKNAAALANLAGGLVCEKVGVVPIEKTELLNEAEKLGQD